MYQNVLDPTRAIFSDEGPFYRFPEEPDAGDVVRLSVRAPKGSTGRVLLLLGNGEGEITMTCDKEMDSPFFAYFTASIICPEEELSYRFLIHVGSKVYLCNRLGASVLDADTPLAGHGDFRILPGFHVPTWAKGAVIYQIFPDRFFNGDEANDVTDKEYYYLGGHAERVTDWSSLPTDCDYRRFYGGDLRGILDKLDYIRSLGVEAIYLNPIFVSPSNHKYDTEDYDHVDPHLGKVVSDREHEMDASETDDRNAERYIHRVTEQENLDAGDELFALLAREIHKRGMRIILDGVFNHCGSFHKWMDREGIYAGRQDYPLGAYHGVESPFRSYFRFDESGSYEGWWGHDTLPKLCYEESDALTEAILRIGEKWVSPPYSADGWRLDVAADLGHSEEFNHTFWKKFRARVKKANPEALILAEHYGSPRAWLRGDEWDTVMNYDAFMEPVSYFLTGMEKHSDGRRDDLYRSGDAFFSLLLEKMSDLPHASLVTAMNELSNHDHSRFLTRTNRTVGRISTLGSEAAAIGIRKAIFRAAVAMQMTLPGCPTIYYADEAGQVGFTDPDNRRTYPWGQEDRGLIDLHRALTSLRQRFPVLRNGSFQPLLSGYGKIAYARFDERYGHAAIVMVNADEIPHTLSLSILELGLDPSTVLSRVFFSDAKGIELPEGVFPALTHCVTRTSLITLTAESGRLTLTLPPESSAIFIKENRKDGII